MSAVPQRADLVVVGGGIVGLATARAAQMAQPRAAVVVLERESAVGLHQSSHNSGVLHSGVYYKPGSMKAELCRRGKEMMERFCSAEAIPVLRNGKLVVAVSEGELARLDDLVDRARANGVADLAVLGAKELRAIEPNVAGIRALHSPTTGVVDFAVVCRALASPLDVHTGVRVTSLWDRGDEVVVHVDGGGEVRARAAVVCAGLWSEQLAARSGLPTAARVIPFRGSWLALRPTGAALVRGNIYPVPDPALPFLGVHFTRRVDGAVWAGPNAVVSLADRALLLRAARFGGSWRLAADKYRTAAVELWTEHSRRTQLRGMRRYLPDLTEDDVSWSERPFGVRAQVVDRAGHLVDDFLMARDGRVVHVLNAPSPAATSALAIAERLADTVADALA